MAHERDPNDPFPPAEDRDAMRQDAAWHEEERARRDALADSELQPDPELAEGPASGSRIALYAIAALVIVAAVFYGLNSATPPTDTATPQSSAPATQADGSVRDVTPQGNMQPGTTTGAAPSAPSTTTIVPPAPQPDSGAK